ncbi:sulfatase [Spiroplasma culicicola]|uniref:Sulfatase n=1 Tax=Spiroplasma culicicola AES-1 TaxID=1276246 RepID=W6AGY9_9MOLU|nr:sulfatase [Spiroplasma culicicola]AHI52954.1 sulfatase [Spiroplasma culicicola AES-1]
MRAVILMFDTLTRKYLPNYGNDWVKAKNFERLEHKAITFDTFYGGSMPCMPARREMHTGRYNFLHRGWGQLEPFDNSVFEILKKNNIYTHLVTDHSHYWEDGGSTYHNRYDTWEGFRGQETDRWMPVTKDLNYKNEHYLNKPRKNMEFNIENRAHWIKEQDYSSVKTVNAGLKFLNKFKDRDNWLLQIECFDPHEPFLVPEEYRKLYGCTDSEVRPNFPKYQDIDFEENKEEILATRKEYAALISMVDKYVGKVLDFFDENNLWEDTMLIINTDHGFSIGEHNFIGKNLAPFYDEIIHTPFFLHIPEFKELDGGRISEVAQTIDIPKTILDYFKISDDYDRDGKSLLKLLKEKQKNHESILFGMNMGHVGIFDGKYVYMRASKDSSNSPNAQYTLNFNLMRGFLPKELLKHMTYVEGSRYSDGVPLMKINLPANGYIDSYKYGNLLFDMENDPEQLIPIKDSQLEQEMINKLIKRLKEVDTPIEIYQRLGLEI